MLIVHDIVYQMSNICSLTEAKVHVPLHLSEKKLINSLLYFMDFLYLSYMGKFITPLFVHAIAVVVGFYLWSESSTASILYVCMQRRLWQVYTVAQGSLSLHCLTL